MVRYASAPATCLSEPLEPRRLLAVQMALLMDTSGSITPEEFEDYKTGLANAIERIVPNGTLELTIIEFSSSANVLFPPTLIESTVDRNAAADAVRSLVNPDGGTNYADAIDTAADLMRASPLHDTAEFQYINMLTDGEPNDVAAAINERDIAIFLGVDVISFEAIDLEPEAQSLLLELAYPQPAILLNSDLTNLPDPFFGSGFVAPLTGFQDVEETILAKFAAAGALDFCASDAQVVDRDGLSILEIRACPEGSDIILELSGNQIQVIDSIGGDEHLAGAFDIGGLDGIEVFGSDSVDSVFSRLGAAFSGGIVIRGMGRSDRLECDTPFAEIYGGDGDDTVIAGGHGSTLFGEAGNDDLTASGSDHTLIGAAGDDRLTGTGSGQLLDGGAGNDTLVGSGAGQTLLGGDGADSLTSSAGENTSLDGGTGNDVLLSHGASADLLGGAGNDALTSHGQLSRLLGGAGGDEILVTGAYTFAWGEADDDVLTGSGPEQRLFGGPGNDVLAGVDNRQALWGEEGDDSLVGGRHGDFLNGGPGNDTLNGQDGDDTLVGGAGDDSLMGREGQDLLWLQDDTAGQEIDLAAGTAVGADGSDVLDSLEHALGGAGDDRIIGDSGANLLIGGDGADTIDGGDGKDTLVGGAGADSMSGGDDHDWVLDFDELFDRNDRDTLFGGHGLDVGLTGEEDDAEEIEQLYYSLDDLLQSL